jgi:DNA-binding transcriptional regulator YiaG
VRLITTTLVELSAEERAALRTRQARGHRGRVAFAVGVSLRTLRSWESGQARPPLARYQRWLEALTAAEGGRP